MSKDRGFTPLLGKRSRVKDKIDFTLKKCHYVYLFL